MAALFLITPALLIPGMMLLARLERAIGAAPVGTPRRIEAQAGRSPVIPAPPAAHGVTGIASAPADSGA